jgi:diguanylate cyclase (GGDEF)-like protein
VLPRIFDASFPALDPVRGSVFRLLAIATAARAPGFAIDASAGWAAAIEQLGGDATFDAVLVDGDLAPASPAEIGAVADRAALVVVVVEPDAEHASGWLRSGADDVIGRDELAGPVGWRRIRFAVERRRRGELSRNEHATDPATGLPHRQQLVEHLSQLLALREREPAPMAVLGFRIEGLRPRGEGAESTDFETLRRKIAVRLRAGVRASDVVASVGEETFAIMLGSILTAADADRVAAKLVAALVAPFTVAGVDRSVAVAFGIAHYPHDGREAERLLRRALALAAAAPAMSAAGPAAVRSSDGGERAAANDDR